MLLRNDGWKWIALAAAASLLIAASARTSAQAGMTSSDIVPARFVDVSAQVGVSFLHQAPRSSLKYILETMESGVALFRYNNDGRQDIFLVNGAPFGDSVPKGTIFQKTDSNGQVQPALS